jgi:hypothetical protein
LNEDRDGEIRNLIELTYPEKLYEIRDENGQPIGFEAADGRQLFNHYRHRMTTYDRVLDNTRAQQGRVTAWQQKQAAVGAAEQILEHYRDEHVKVIQDSQKKGQILKTLLQKAGVGTVSALTNLLDSCSDKLKDIGKLENSQRALQTWNDTYRVQRDLVKEILQREGLSPDVLAKVNAIYSTRSVNKAVERGSDLLNLEKSEILKLVKTAIRYAKLQAGGES